MKCYLPSVIVSALLAGSGSTRLVTRELIRHADQQSEGLFDRQMPCEVSRLWILLVALMAGMLLFFPHYQPRTLGVHHAQKHNL